MLVLLLPICVGGACPVPMVGRWIEVLPMLGDDHLYIGGLPFRTPADDEVSVTECRFYVSGFTLFFADSTTYHAPAGYQLIDAEKKASWSVPLPYAPMKAVVAVSFVVGVDSAASMGGALGGPLDPALGMYWAWQSGYINAKIEGISPSRPAAARHRFAFHIGGYAAPYATRRTVWMPLARPSEAKSLTLVADVGQWLGAAPLAATPDVLVPGAAAAVQADRLAAMFRIEGDTPKKFFSSTLSVDAPH